MEKKAKNCREYSDADLVRLTFQDENYFLCLMERYEDRLLRYILKISSVHVEEAEDVLQEVYIKVYRNLAGFDESLSFSSWIYRITRNETINHFRKNKVYYTGLSPEENELLLNNIYSDTDLGEGMDEKFQKNNINKILSKLDDKYREVLVLKFLEEKDYKEIAHILQKPMGTIATLINRAKIQFKEEIKKADISLE